MTNEQLTTLVLLLGAAVLILVTWLIVICVQTNKDYRKFRAEQRKHLAEMNEIYGDQETKTINAYTRLIETNPKAAAKIKNDYLQSLKNKTP